MFGISGEHLLVLGIVLLIFGPRRLPELGNTLGKAIRNFKDAVSGIEEAKFRKIDEATPKQENLSQENSQVTQKPISPSDAPSSTPLASEKV